MESDLVEKWVNALSAKCSEGKSVKEEYKEAFERFLGFAGKSAQDIMDDYAKGSAKQVKKDYAELLVAYLAHLQKLKYSPNSVRAQIDVVRSFFKHYNLAVAFGFRAHLQFLFK